MHKHEECTTRARLGWELDPRSTAGSGPGSLTCWCQAGQAAVNGSCWITLVEDLTMEGQPLTDCSRERKEQEMKERCTPGRKFLQEIWQCFTWARAQLGDTQKRAHGTPVQHRLQTLQHKAASPPGSQLPSACLNSENWFCYTILSTSPDITSNHQVRGRMFMYISLLLERTATPRENFCVLRLV